ncbi:hypothetical protein [Caballeronia grimmiae]|uniref:Glycine zipper 2TM domain-containing protein n=2 Tax=Burkholderiaceae TaxID=119060 RepID=A4JU88_BURVG|nr:conserved hypothetical protein [Burkholderia vietnamiensis G4]
MEIFMKKIAVVLSVFCVLAMSANSANAAGCFKGAMAGALVGHWAGHHAVAGAIAGCAVGHHLAKSQERERASRQRHTRWEQAN